MHLAIPAKDVFIDDSQKPTASVLVSMRPGTNLSSQQVQSIVHLVASGIEGMDPTDVTVADSTGRLLSSSDGTTGSAASDANQSMTENYEDDAAGDLQAVLDRVLGPGKAVATVAAQLSFDDVDTTTKRVYTDKNAKPIAESETTETYGGNGSGNGTSGYLGTDNIATPGAVTGAGTTADSNAVTTGGTGAGASGNGGYEKKTATKNNANSEETITRKAAPGQVVRQDVSVMIDSKAAANVDMAKPQQNLSTAAGVDTKRGDTIAVNPIPFDTSASAQAASEPQGGTVGRAAHAGSSATPSRAASRCWCWLRC
nr:flagellar M-ring protein FliF C-terminal domain-containing protein [Angustibacter aerolatus]